MALGKSQGPVCKRNRSNTEHCGYWINQYNQNSTHMHAYGIAYTLRWRHNERDSVSNHQPHDCLLNRLFRRRSKKTSKLRVTGLCEGNSPGTGEFPAQMASYVENVSIWWRHHESISWWRHDIVISSAVLAFYEENPSHKGQWCGSLVCSLLVWTSCWTSSRIADDFRHNDAHVKSL